MAYLRICTLVVNLSQQPVNPVITGKEDGVVFSWLLLQLDGYGNQLVIAIDIQQANGSSTILSLTSWETIHDGQVTGVHMSSLHTLKFTIMHVFYHTTYPT